MRLDPFSLSLFVAVVEKGTIAAAAERGNIAASAVSKRLSELEAALGTPLLVRSNKGMTATPAGELLLNLARRALHDLDDIYFQMRNHASGVRGRVRLFATNTAVSHFMPLELKSFFAKHPGVDVHLEERSSTEIAQAVIENETDIGIVSPIGVNDDLVTYPYHLDEFVLIVPIAHPLAERSAVPFADTLDFDFVLTRSSSWIATQLPKTAAELGRQLKVRMQVTTVDAVRAMVQAGLGIAVVSRPAAELYAPVLGLRVLTIQEEWAHRRFSVCVRSRDPLSEAGRLLLQHIVRQEIPL